MPKFKQYQTPLENKIIISKQDQSYIPHSENSTIEVIPNGVDSDFYQSSVTDKKYDLLFSVYIIQFLFVKLHC